MIKLIGIAAGFTILLESGLHLLYPNIHLCDFSCWLKVGSIGTLGMGILLFILCYFGKLNLLFSDKEKTEIQKIGNFAEKIQILTESPILKLAIPLLGILVFLLGSYTLKPIKCLTYCKLHTVIELSTVDGRHEILKNQTISLMKDSDNILKISPTNFGIDTTSINNKIATYKRIIHTTIWIPTYDSQVHILVNGNPTYLTPNWEQHKMENQPLEVNNETLHEFLKDVDFLSVR